jgi:hypothetical protein
MAGFLLHRSRASLRWPQLTREGAARNFGVGDYLIRLGVCGLSPSSALLSVFDRLSAPDRRSPMRCLSFSDRVSIPDRRSFVVRLPSPDRFSSLPIVVSVGCRESCWMVQAISGCRRATAAREGWQIESCPARGSPRRRAQKCPFEGNCFN